MRHACKVCGALVVDRIGHVRWHQSVVRLGEAVDNLITAMGHVRNVLLAVEEEVDHLGRRA